MDWHHISADDALAELESDRERGLTSDDAARRLERYGPNKIHKAREISPLRIFLAQFNDFLIYLLLAAAAFSLAIGFLPENDPNYTDVTLILLIVVANGLFGFVQDYRAEKAMEALRELSTPETRVIRDGEKHTVPATELVPGDVIVVGPGDRIPADARVIEAETLETVEAPLTGESGNVSKDAEPIDADTPLAERNNMLFMNTDAVKGRGTAVVVATGMETEVGAIAAEIEQAEDKKTPFQYEVDRMGRRIAYGIVGLILIVAAVEYFFTSASLLTIVMVAVSLAVAAVPEGLPAVVTLTLALGSRRMAKQNALVRKLAVVEGLGSVDVIVTDKTGTLTESQMTVRRLYFSGEEYEVTGEGVETEGEFRRDGEGADPSVLEPLLSCGAIVNDAERAPEAEERAFYGDPTEVAVLVSAAKAGIEPDVERAREIPFSSERKRMTVIVDGDPAVAYMKGAPEVVLDSCDRVLVEGEAQPLDDELRHSIEEKNESFANQAYRVLAFARKELRDVQADDEAIESGMVFLGLQAMIDPPRSEVREAVEECRSAGIRVVMVTGDNLATAKAIGKSLGFDPEGAMTGQELEELSEEDIKKRVEDVHVFARVTPQHKVKLLQALQDLGHRVAMTGDGVNDAPALRNADVGVAMGQRGTDVAKEASAMILRDDNFVTIRNAVAEGRGIFDNTRKFVTFLLSGNAGEILVVFLGVLIGSALFRETFAGQVEAVILTPVMLLWINLVTDGLPALALGTDPRMPGIMKRPPRPRDESVIHRRVIVWIAIIAVAMTVTGLPVFFGALAAGFSLATAQTLLFTHVVLVEMAQIQIIRRYYQQSIFSNRWLLAAVLSSLVLHGIVLYSPLNRFFRVIPLDAVQWLWLVGSVVGFVVLTAIGFRLYERLFHESAAPATPS